MTYVFEKPTNPELEFLKSQWGLGTAEEEGYRTGLPGYIGCRNAFLGIDSGAPYMFKNTGSVYTEVYSTLGERTENAFNKYNCNRADRRRRHSITAGVLKVV